MPPRLPRHSSPAALTKEALVIAGNVPKVTGAVRERCAELAADPSPVTQRVYALLEEFEDNYTTLLPTIRQDVLQFLSFAARLWFNSVLSGTFPSAEEIETLAQTGRRRVHQGVALSSLLRGFRFGGREVWNALLGCAENNPEARDELLFVISRYQLEFFDSLSQTISQAYLDEQYQRLRWRDSLRYELVTLVFQFPDDVEAFQRTAESLGLDPTAARVALVLDVKLPKATPNRLEGELDRLTLSASRQLKCSYEDLVRVLHRERLVIWAPCVRGDTLVAADRRLFENALALVRAVPEIQAVGIGLMNQGALGWATSVDEAFKALEFGVRGTAARKVHLYSDIAVNESVRRTNNVLRYLDSLLERLAGEPDLLVTLQTYFDEQQRRKTAADVLGIHPNTLNHRLERIESLLGCKLDDAGWIAKLHVALRLRQRSLSGPDDT
jgi:sugar diacid utilization regulator